MTSQIQHFEAVSLKIGNLGIILKTVIHAHSEEPDKMPHNVAFHQCLHCLIKSSEKEIQIYLEIITCHPSIYTMDHSKFIV